MIFSDMKSYFYNKLQKKGISEAKHDSGMYPHTQCFISRHYVRDHSFLATRTDHELKEMVEYFINLIIICRKRFLKTKAQKDLRKFWIGAKLIWG